VFRGIARYAEFIKIIGRATSRKLLSKIFECISANNTPKKHTVKTAKIIILALTIFSDRDADHIAKKTKIGIKK
jgi:hypothetical protein